MRATSRVAGAAARVALILMVGALLAGCASADKKAAASSSSASRSGSSASVSDKSSGSNEMMSAMGAEGTSTSVDGIKAVPMQTLGSTDWEGMKITAKAMTAVPFVLYNGTKEREVKPGKASFHLMVFLNDAHTGVVIPYAGVWATISKAGKVVSDERQWPMLARYMGPHYGNDVTVPGAGSYELSLLISPPVSARHMEYAHVWLKPHRVSFTFHWKPV